MGTGQITPRQKPAPDESQSLAPLPVNLIVNPFLIQPVSTVGFVPAAVGTTIMREGFVTETGFLIGSHNT
jgi:hypothetical protein